MFEISQLGIEKTINITCKLYFVRSFLSKLRIQYHRKKLNHCLFSVVAFICSNLTIKTTEQCVKSVQSKH